MVKNSHGGLAEEAGTILDFWGFRELGYSYVDFDQFLDLEDHFHSQNRPQHALTHLFPSIVNNSQWEYLGIF